RTRGDQPGEESQGEVWASRRRAGGGASGGHLGGGSRRVRHAEHPVRSAAAALGSPHPLEGGDEAGREQAGGKEAGRRLGGARLLCFSRRPCGSSRFVVVGTLDGGDGGVALRYCCRVRIAFGW